jgi:hypothetical protein
MDLAIQPRLPAFPGLEGPELPKSDVLLDPGRREHPAVLGYQGLDDYAPEHGDHSVLFYLDNLTIYSHLHLPVLAHVGAGVWFQQGIGLYHVGPVRAIIGGESVHRAYH